MNHVIELKKVDGGWFFEVDRDANHGGCGTKPTLEEALAEAAVMIPRIENYTSAQPDSKSMLCAPLNAKEQPVENSQQGSLKDFSVAKTLEGFSKEPPQPTVFSPQKGKP